MRHDRRVQILPHRRRVRVARQDRTEVEPMNGGVIVCGPGCCPGCQDCYGMQIGCHQDPCRCDQPCSCDWSQADESPHWQDGCLRHDADDDTRSQECDDGPEDYGLCPVCGEGGRCAEDDEGRPLFHSGAQS